VIGYLLLAMALQSPDFEPLYRQALDQRTRQFGESAAKTVESARDLALYLAARGDFSRAASYREPALAAATTTEAATVLHNWGVAVEEADAPFAERLYRKALAIRASALPALDVELATTRLNLAGLILARESAESGKLASLALRSFERSLGAMDARAGTACGILGAVAATKGDALGAERMFRRALAIAEKAHGPQAPETASALENLADLLEQTGRRLAAGPLLQRAQQIRANAR
jgi:tetratricopeptide (TPR) repeat protein